MCELIFSYGCAQLEFYYSTEPHTVKCVGETDVDSVMEDITVHYLVNSETGGCKDQCTFGGSGSGATKSYFEQDLAESQQQSTSIYSCTNSNR